MKNKNRSAFTLIELLVVIAIIAILAVVVVLTLNPAELLRQARDSNRVSDFATIKSAISLFGADVTTSTANVIGTYATLYGTSGMGAITVTTATFTGNAGYGYATTSVTNAFATTTNRTVSSQSGWIPVNLSAISSGAPIGEWPIDPINGGSNFYTYVASGTTFKLATKMESAKYGLGGGGDVVSTDGGNSTGTYEQGTNLGL